MLARSYHLSISFRSLDYLPRLHPSFTLPVHLCRFPQNPSLSFLFSLCVLNLGKTILHKVSTTASLWMTPKLTSLSLHWLLDFSIWTYSSSISSSVCPNPNFHPCPKLPALPFSTVLFSLPQHHPAQSGENHFLPSFPLSLHTSHHRFQYPQFPDFWDRHTSFSKPWHFLKPLLEHVTKLFKSLCSQLLPSPFIL